ncbi:MAG: hypothetical protein ACE5E5_02650 [Phycisphaerae bacterium]
MSWIKRSSLWIVVGGFWIPGLCLGQIPDHPIITEVFNNPTGNNDAPVGADAGNLHQEFIEIYIPPLANLSAGLNADALNLAFYEVEGDRSSSGNTLVNYRFDLPTFDLNPANGMTGLPRPASGVVVLGWVDYVFPNAGNCSGNGQACSVSSQNCADGSSCRSTPTALAGTPGTRVAMVNGGVTSTGDFLFVAINGDQFGGTTNFPTPPALSFINMPNEANSGMIQNGSGAYLLVNRDDPGYVELYDDGDPVHVPPIANADPSLATGTVLQVSSFLDGYAANDDSGFVVTDQPYPLGTSIDLADVLGAGTPYALLIAQIAEEDTTAKTPSLGGGYARMFVDVPKTTETAAPDNPVTDALNAYRLVRNEGPFFPTPGRAVLTTSPPELGVATSQAVAIEVLGETTAHPGLIAANTGGAFPIDIAVTGGTPDVPGIITLGAGFAVTNVAGQTFAFPTAAITPTPQSVDGATVSGTVDVEATNSNVGDPAVLSPLQTVPVTATVLKPTTGTAANGLPFQTTIFVAVQGISAQAGVNNEFLTTSLGQFLAAQPDITALDTNGNGLALINPITNIALGSVVQPMVKDLPADGEECSTWQNPAGPVGGLDFATTVTTSAEVQSGSTAYDTSIGFCPITQQTVIRSIRLNVPDTRTFGGSFSPSETVHFIDATGTVGILTSGLTNTTTTRTFEAAIIDTNVRTNNTVESGNTDDFGMLLSVAETEPGAPVVVGEFVAISMTGGFGLADIDSLSVPEGDHLANIIYLDLDNLHDVLGIKAVEAFYVVDAGASGSVDVIEAFSLNLSAAGGQCQTNADCDDGVFCNGAETCDAFQTCQPGTPPNCSDGIACTTDSCNAMTNQCDHIPNNAVCNDGIACTSDSCNPAVGCQNLPNDAGCNDGIACTSDSCNPAVGCQNLPDNGLCSDGVFCNGVEACDPAAGDPITGCTNPGPPCPDCNEVDGCGCMAPLAEGMGNRYLRLTPKPIGGPLPSALVVSSCGGTIQQYVGPLPGETGVVGFDQDGDGVPESTVAGLVDDPANALWLTSDQWGGSVFVTGLLVAPDTCFDVFGDCGSPGNPILTPPVPVCTTLYGDIDLGGSANLADVFTIVLGFQGVFTDAQRAALDLAPCQPDQVINIGDVFFGVLAFQGTPFAVTCAQSTCP